MSRESAAIRVNSEDLRRLKLVCSAHGHLRLADTVRVVVDEYWEAHQDMLRAAVAGREALRRPPPPKNLEGLLAKVRPNGVRAGDLASDQTGLENAIAGLAELEVLGHVRRVPGGRYVLSEE